jgi:hypothetical protein
VSCCTALHAAGADDAARLLRAPHAAGTDDAARTLVTRAAEAGMFGLFLAAHPDQAPSYRFGREPDGTPSAAWTWPEPTSHPRD